MGQVHRAIVASVGSSGVGSSGVAYAPSGVIDSTATWNPSDKGTNITLSNANLTAQNATAAWQAVRGTVSAATGKRYYEIVLNSDRTNPYSSVQPIMGVARSTHTLADYCGSGGAFGYGVQFNTATTSLKFSPSALPSYAAHATLTVIGIALDLDAGTIKYSFDGVDKGTANSGITGTYFPAVWVYLVNPTTTRVTARFAASTWSYPDTYPGYDQWT